MATKTSKKAAPAKATKKAVTKKAAPISIEELRSGYAKARQTVAIFVRSKIKLIENEIKAHMKMHNLTKIELDDQFSIPLDDDQGGYKVFYMQRFFNYVSYFNGDIYIEYVEDDGSGMIPEPDEGECTVEDLAFEDFDLAIDLLSAIRQKQYTIVKENEDE